MLLQATAKAAVSTEREAVYYAQAVSCACRLAAAEQPTPPPARSQSINREKKS